MFKRKRRGFTLIELIMVIVIIGILAAIAVPKFINLRKDAQQAACQGSIGAIRTALGNYYARTAIAGTAVFPNTLHQTEFLFYLGEDTLPAHPATGWDWTSYYTLGTNSATYTLSDSACTGW